MKRRNLDLRKIRTTIPYSVSEIADLLDITKATVRRWIASGLPCIDDQKPTLVHGSDLKSWLEKKKQSRKSKCAHNEMLCLKCRQPRLTMPGSVVVVQTNPKTAMVKAICIVCGTQMNKAASTSIAADWGKPKLCSTPMELNLIVSTDVPLNDDSEMTFDNDLFKWSEKANLQSIDKEIEKRKAVKGK